MTADVTPIGDLRRVIMRDPDHLVGMVDQAEALIAQRGRIYVRGDQLATVVRGAVDAGVRVTASTPRIARVSRARMVEELSEIARWARYGKDDQIIPTMPPPIVADTLLARGTWRLPPLTGIVTQPTMRRDGSILAEDGYDAATGLLVELDGEYPEVPARPDHAAAVQAMRRLIAPWDEYDLDPVGRGVLVSGLLSHAVRDAIDGPIPLHAITSPIKGSGKGLAVACAVLIGTGHMPSLMAHQQDDRETRKRITSVLMEGLSSVVLDDVEGPLGSPSLAAVLTAWPTWTDRVLGVSQTAVMPTRTIWWATGNGLSVRRDIGRRVLLATIDPKCAHPEDRRFCRRDLIGWVREHRRDLLSAALTVMRAYHVAGRPEHGQTPMGSYGAWEALVRGAIIWTGLDEVGDPWGSRETIRADADQDRDDHQTLIVEWLECCGEAALQLRAVLDRASPGLRDALGAYVRAGAELNQRNVGAGLRKVRDRIVIVDGEEWMLITDGRGKGGRVYWRAARASGVQR